MGKRGRPTKRTEAVEKKIIDGLQAGTPMTVLCRADDMPDPATVWRWAEDDEKFSQDIARARTVGFDAIAEEALEIADDGSQDYTLKKGKNGEEYEAFDAEHVQRSKLRVETRLKLLAKWDPKRYGELLKVGNPDGTNLKTEPDEATKYTRLAALVAAGHKALSDEPADHSG